MKAKALINYAKMVSNQLQSRFDLMDSMFGTYQEYKMDNECGYPLDITPQLYKQFYLREGIATRVVGIMPDECWKKKPEVTDTDDAQLESPFELALLALDQKMAIWQYLHRIDELSGIGRFGILLLGIDDGLPLDQPVEGLNEWGEGEPTDTPTRQLLYMRPFDESLVLINQFEVNPNSPRYGKPLYYSVNFIDSTQWGTVSPIGSETLTMRRIHWSRVIHIAEHTSSSEIFGLPRMQKVFNRLYDLKKICGGSAEMFWKGGYPGLSLEVNPDMLDVELDKDSVDREMRSYQSGLKRYLAMTGISAKSLAPAIADPTPHLNLQLQCIALSIKCPLRVFTGTEQGVLAGSQDATAWATRVEHRRENHIEHRVIRPFIDRLINLQVLPKPDEDDIGGYKIKWKELTSPDEQTQAQIIATKTSALAQYVGSQVDNLIPPVEYFVHIFGMDLDDAQEIVDAAGQHLGVELSDMAAQKTDQTLNPPEMMAEEEAVPTENEKKIKKAASKAVSLRNQAKSPAEGRKTLTGEQIAANRKESQDLINTNGILRKAQTEKTCLAIEALARMDLGEKWTPEMQNSPAAAMSRNAVTMNVNEVEDNTINHQSASRLIMLHNEASEALMDAGAVTAAKWHLGRAKDLSEIYYPEETTENARGGHDGWKNQPRAKGGEHAGEWTRATGGKTWAEFYGDKNGMIPVRLLKKTKIVESGKEVTYAVGLDGKPLEKGKPRIWHTPEGKISPVDVNKLAIEGAIPPGWHSVMVNPDPKHPLQAIGIDSIGKPQSKYAATVQSKNKGEDFALIDNMVASGHDKEIIANNAKILATTPPTGTDKASKKARWRYEDAQVVSLIAATGVRPGGAALKTVASHDSFGAVDFEGRHVKELKDGVYLNYVPGKKRGKKGKAPEKVWVKIHDPEVAKMVVSLAKKSGPKMPIFPSATAATVNIHIKTLGHGSNYSAKNFRTRLATVTAKEYVSKTKVHGRFNSEESYEKWMKGMLEHVATRIPDSLTVLRKSYVSPSVYKHLIPKT